MSERLRACDRWHPDTPSELSVYARKDRNGCAYDQVWCLTCGRERCKNYRKKQGTKKGSDLLPRLNWAPPQISTGE